MSNQFHEDFEIIFILIEAVKNFPETPFLIFFTFCVTIFCVSYYITASKYDLKKIMFIFESEKLNAFDAATLRGPYFIFQTALFSLVQKGIIIIKGPDQFIDIKETKYNHLHLYEQDLYHHLSNNRGTPSKLFDHNIEDRVGFRIDEVNDKIKDFSNQNNKSDITLKKLKNYSGLLLILLAGVRLYFAEIDTYTFFMTLLISIVELLLMFFITGAINKSIKRNAFKKFISFTSDEDNDLFTVSVFGLKALDTDKYKILLESLKQRNNFQIHVPGAGRGNYENIIINRKYKKDTFIDPDEYLKSLKNKDN